MNRNSICVHATALVALCLSLDVAAAQASWTTPLRGSWVQTGTLAQGDVILAGRDGAAQIVVGDNENAAVHQAAEFLAGDIAKISGRRPSIETTPSREGGNIHLVTLGIGAVPAAVDTAAMRGQW